MPNATTGYIPSYIPGIETQVASARAHRHTNRLISIPVSPTERAFLLAGLAHISATADAILHGTPFDGYRAPWGRAEIVQRLRDLVADLRRHDVLRVTNELQRRALREAIEGNPYFALMAHDDPRLCPAAITLANALRVRLARVLGIKIAPVPLGTRRTGEASRDDITA
jgi:hypothetical protein